MGQKLWVSTRNGFWVRADQVVAVGVVEVGTQLSESPGSFGECDVVVRLAVPAGEWETDESGTSGRMRPATYSLARLPDAKFAREVASEVMVRLAQHTDDAATLKVTLDGTVALAPLPSVE